MSREPRLSDLSNEQIYSLAAQQLERELFQLLELMDGMRAALALLIAKQKAMQEEKAPPHD